MSHPKNRLERFVLGNTKSKSRVINFIHYTRRKSPESQELLKKWAKKRRNTTKTCSKACCGNPRKFFNEKTRQEVKFGGGPIYLD